MAVKKSPRVVVITGASGGIGRASARLFAQQGDHVALLARGSTGLEAAAPGGPTRPIPEDRLDARTGTSARIDRRLPNAPAHSSPRRKVRPARSCRRHRTAALDACRRRDRRSGPRRLHGHPRPLHPGPQAPGDHQRCRSIPVRRRRSCVPPSISRPARIRKPPPATPPGPELRSSHRREAAPMSSTTGAASTSNVPDIHAWEPPSAPHDLAVMGGRDKPQAVDLRRRP